AKPVAGTPEVCGAGLVRHVSQHPGNLTLLDPPKGLPAELEVVALLVNGVTSITENQNSIVNAFHEVIERNILLGCFERNIGHSRNRNARPIVGIETAI